MKSSFTKQTGIGLLFSVCLGTSFTLNAQPSDANSADEVPASQQAAATDEGKLPLDELRSFADVFNHIRLSYVEEIDDKTLLENAIRGMLSGLDPHSSYLDAKSFDDLQVSTTGEFGGLGLEVGMENGYVKVISPIDDTPAEKAGIESGDLIIQLDSKPVKGMSLNEAVKLMRGKKGSDIELTIVREGIRQPFDVTVTRDIIKVVSVRSKTLEEGFGYVRVAQFQSKTGSEFRKAITSLQAEDTPMKGLVVDLRNNPGGILQSSVEVADTLLEEGLIVYTEGRLSDSHSEYSATPNDLTNGVPVVVLINGGSASASEIVAGALQDHHRAVIMGTDSFGKGSVQTVVPLSEKHAIKLTTARYFTPNGRSIQAQGIVPDIVVERAKIEAIKTRDRVTEADLQGHLSSTDGDESDSKKRQSKAKDKLFNSDNQLYEALNLLKGLHILSLNEKATKVASKTEQPEEQKAL
ncbi:S41 family peptidase [Oceanicoccus sagamiensis]|uniref:Peptidase S41 n=1 Tax=Oceanicoccus sagamiensis TaxID=716816 RepID=A0A1X9NNH0_9GAMM|nr:S41 family peptidase [Oceanicoccus sagamiensis]ARN76307.1 peptidase S41 [Oceanicoccus sagamiensis]